MEGGEIASAAELQDDSIVVTHDIGAQVFSERARLGIRTVDTVATAASTTFLASVGALPELHKVLGFQVFVSNSARLTNVTLALSDEAESVAIPVWHWDVGTGTELSARFEGATNRILLLPGAATAAQFPQRNFIGFGLTNEPENINRWRMRGTTSAFGAGTLVVSLRLLIAFYNRTNALQLAGGFGPLPSW